MRQGWKPSLAALIATLCVGAAQAQSDATPVRTAVGAWRLSEVGGKVDCTLDLTDEAGGPASPAGKAAKAAFACRQAFPPLQTLAIWNLDDKGDIVLADAAGKPLAVFAGQPGGPLEAKIAGGRVWRLQAVPDDRSAVKPGATAPR